MNNFPPVTTDMIDGGDEVCEMSQAAAYAGLGVTPELAARVKADIDAYLETGVGPAWLVDELIPALPKETP